MGVGTPGEDEEKEGEAVECRRSCGYTVDI